MPRTSRRATMASTTPAVNGAANASLITPPVLNGHGQHHQQERGKKVSRMSAAAAARSPSPLSPTRITRHEEKREMQNLNDRLASYIERVRSQESEIATLHREIAMLEGSKDSEVGTLRTAFQAEIDNLRKALDAASKERARYQMEADKQCKDAVDLAARLTKEEGTVKRMAADAKKWHAERDSLRARLDAAESELSVVRPQMQAAHSKLDETRRALESETLRRIELDNQLQTVQDEMRFEKELLERHLRETKARTQVELSQLDGDLQRQYDDKLQASLTEFRDAYETQMVQSRDEFFRLYETKMRSLQTKLDEAQLAVTDQSDAVEEWRARAGSLATEVDKVAAANKALQLRVDSLTSDLEAAARQFRTDLSRKETELKSKEEQVSDMLKDYRDLMEIKVGLDLEIAAYRKLIEGEEHRLGMSAYEMTEEDGTSPAGWRASRKRRRLHDSTSFDALLPDGEGEAMTGGDVADGGTVSSGGTVVNVVTTHTKPFAESRAAVDGEANGNDGENDDTSGSVDVEIDVLEHRGKCIRIRNCVPPDAAEEGSSSSEAATAAIGGFTLANVTGGEITSYKFHRSTKIGPGETCTVWSSDSGQTHAPPLNLVLKSGNWDFGDENVTTICDKDGHELACRTTRFERVITPRFRATGRRVGGASARMQNGSADRCAVM